METNSIQIQNLGLESSRYFLETSGNESSPEVNLLSQTFQAESTTVTLNSANEPLQLTFAAATEKIKELLEPTLGKNAIQNALNQDFSPQATADRIVNFATGFFGSYRQRNADAAPDTALSNFMDLIRGAIDKGFREARDILKGLSVLNGDIAADIDKTYNLVQKGLDGFQAANSQAAQATKPVTTPAEDLIAA